MKIYIILLTILTASHLARAEESAVADVDDVITNNKLRADSGSKSLWSIKSRFSYFGGTIDEPFAQDRPNISGASGTIKKSVLDGQISGKYNISAQSSLMAGVGIRWIAPLSTNGPTNYDGDQFDAQNPYAVYQYVYNWSGVQSVFQIQPTYFTNVNLVREGYVANVEFIQDNMFEVGHSNLSVGLLLAVRIAYFDKTGPVGDPQNPKTYLADVRTDQSDYIFWVDPELEYKITDRINFRTILNLWNFEHLRSESRATSFRWDKVYQSVGIGFSITRDIFLYPNVRFLPDNIRADLTNVSLLANINIF